MADTVLMSTLYIVLAFVLVSLSGTYQFTNKYLGKLVNQQTQATYGTGNSFSNRGFDLHIVVFALLVGVPMYMMNKK